MNLVKIGKQLVGRTLSMVFDTTVELLTIDSATGVDANGDPLPPTTTVVWEGKAAIIPNLPRYERSAVAQPVIGVEERRVVYFVYVPWEAPVTEPGVVVRHGGRVYELIKEPLPMGGSPSTLWRLDCGAPL